MLLKIAYFQILGQPLIIILGGIGIIILVFTAMTPRFTKKGIIKISFQWHTMLAKIGLAFALVHVLLAVFT